MQSFCVFDSTDYAIVSQRSFVPGGYFVTLFVSTATSSLVQPEPSSWLAASSSFFFLSAMAYSALLRSSSFIIKRVIHSSQASMPEHVGRNSMIGWSFSTVLNFF